MGSVLRAGYTVDSQRWAALNAQGRNYWWAYLSEITDRLGIRAVAIPVRELRSWLPGLSLLFVEPGDWSDAEDDLRQWLASGGILIACAPEGLDGLFGCANPEHVPQTGGDYSVAADLYLADTPFTSDIHSPLHPEKPLVVASPMRLVRSAGSMELASFDGRAAVTAVPIGAGWAFYFGFDLAQTFWVIQQGRPVDADHDGDGYLRTSDAIVIGEHEPEVAYADELLLLIQNIAALKPFPLVHQLPPASGEIPDLVLHYGGDDEGESDVQFPAAEFMNSLGLNYHINCMLRDGRFSISPAQAAELEELGTELSLHYNFMDNFQHPGAFTQEDVREQTRRFVEHFGRLPVCCVNHWVRWTGWAEPALWMEAEGVTADNSFIHVRAEELNPVNRIGFGFGTSFPFFFYTDSRMGNRRTGFLELPIVSYEVGYRGSETDFPRLETALVLAEHYGATMNFFYHPVYIARHAACRAAIERLCDLAEERGICVHHSTPDRVAKWWLDRSRTVITNVRVERGRLSFRASTLHPEGFIARIPLGDCSPARLDRPYRIVEKYGRRWLLVALPQGEAAVEVELGVAGQA